MIISTLWRNPAGMANAAAIFSTAGLKFTRTRLITIMKLPYIPKQDVNRLNIFPSSITTDIRPAEGLLVS